MWTRATPPASLPTPNCRIAKLPDCPISALSLYEPAYVMMVQGRYFMIDQGKLQKGRGWAYLVGIVIVAVVAVWKYLIR